MAHICITFREEDTRVQTHDKSTINAIKNVIFFHENPYDHIIYLSVKRNRHFSKKNKAIQTD